MRAILRLTDVLMINDSETRMLANEHNLLRAARHIFKLGPKTLVIKRGEHGALMVHKDWVFAVPALAAGRSARSDRRGRQLRRRVHGLSGKRSAR